MSISNNFITQLFNSKIIKILPNILLKFIIRKKKIYFIKSDLNILPSTNYPFEFREHQLDQYFEIIDKKKNNLPFNEFPHLALLLKSIFQNRSSFSLLDFGAQFIDNFLFLKKNNPNMIYYYHDQKDNNLAIQKFIEKKKLKDIYVLQNIDENKSINYDFVYFGSVIQYIENYKKIIEDISVKKPKYVFFSGTSFYFNHSDEFLITKQLNVFPQINYCYFFNYNNLSKLLSKNNYYVDYVCENINGKLINYKHVNKVINDECKYLDILFKLDE